MFSCCLTVKLKLHITASPASGPDNDSLSAQQAIVTEKLTNAPIVSSRTASHRPTAMKEVKEWDASSLREERRERKRDEEWKARTVEPPARDSSIWETRGETD
jgi:hypothetical protein